LETGIWGARCNVVINCNSLVDTQLRDSIIEKVESIYADAKQKSEDILNRIEMKNK